MKVFGLLFALVAIASCSPVSHDESVPRSMVGNFMDCSNKDFGLCLKEHALKVAERLRSARKVSIIDGITILNASPKQARSLDILPSDPQERNKAVTQRLWDTTADLLEKAELEISFGGEDDTTEVGESRDLKKKKEQKKKIKMLLPFILLAKAKAILLITISAIVIAASLAKLALLAKIAFIFKAIAIIKALLAKKASAEEHVWAAPHVEDAHGHGWEGGWSRSKNDASNLAYSAYRK